MHRNLCVLLLQSFGDSLQSLKISAGGASGFNDLVHATSRGEAVSCRLSLESLTSLPYLPALTHSEVFFQSPSLFTQLRTRSDGIDEPFHTNANGTAGTS